MKLLIVGVNGRVGSLVAKIALSRGLEVTGLGKGGNSLHLQNYVQKDALELTKEEVSCYDVVVDAVGGWTEETIPNITKVMIHLSDLLTGTKTRLIVVGGARIEYSGNKLYSINGERVEWSGNRVSRIGNRRML